MQQTCGACRGQGTVIADPCPTCRGRGAVQVERTVQINVPPGVDEGNTLRVGGEGEGGDPGAPPGDLYCVLRIRPHPLFVRQASELHCEVPIAFSQAALGGPLEVPTLEGRFMNVTLQRGAQAGDEIRVPGKGMPSVRGGRTGDLVIHLRLVTPTGLNKRQEELFRELAELDGKHVSPEHTSFLDRVKAFFTSHAESSAGEKTTKGA